MSFHCNQEGKQNEANTAMEEPDDDLNALLNTHQV
jgi:hypothetical protein